MKKTIIALILILALVFPAGQSLARPDEAAEAAPEISVVEQEMQRYILITVIRPSLLVSGTNASYALTVTCISSVNSVRATLQIQQYKNGSWVDYSSSWTASSSSYLLNTSGTKTVVSGFSYRLKAVITASNGTTTETVTEYS